MMGERHAAMTNRSLRTIRTASTPRPLRQHQLTSSQELEFLTDTSVITAQQLTTILSHLPSQTPLHAPIRDISPNTAVIAATTPVILPPVSPPAAPSLSDQHQVSTPFYAPIASTSPAPPAYTQPAPPSLPPQGLSQGPPSLATASALYAYTPSDAGDLALQPNDRVTITEFMNLDWAKGRNERTGQVGIFPRSYVRVTDEKSAFGAQAAPPPPPGMGYGNMPLEVAQGPGGGPVQGPVGGGKFGETGKKFGKKLGNAAIFGAGATMGADLVNSIF